MNTTNLSGPVRKQLGTLLSALDGLEEQSRHASHPDYVERERILDTVQDLLDIKPPDGIDGDQLIALARAVVGGGGPAAGAPVVRPN